MTLAQPLDADLIGIVAAAGGRLLDAGPTSLLVGLPNDDAIRDSSSGSWRMAPASPASHAAAPLSRASSSKSPPRIKRTRPTGARMNSANRDTADAGDRAPDVPRSHPAPRRAPCSPAHVGGFLAMHGLGLHLGCATVWESGRGPLSATHATRYRRSAPLHRPCPHELPRRLHGGLRLGRDDLRVSWTAASSTVS